MNEAQSNNDSYNLALPYSNKVLNFLRTELKLGKKYVVLDIHSQNAQISNLLLPNVHLICSLTTDPSYHHFLTSKLKAHSNFISINASPEYTTIDDDSIDCIFIDETFRRYDSQKIMLEFERILRLNSYVLLSHHEYLKDSNAFTKDFKKWVHQLLHTKTYNKPPSSTELNEFYKNGFQQQYFQHQKSFTKEDLLNYTRILFDWYGQLWTAEKAADLTALYDKHSKNNKVILEYRTVIAYGLFNYSVPEISLRKSIFFNMLRPFAFGFYVLVKGNIYFWKALYKIKDKILPNKRNK